MALGKRESLADVGRSLERWVSGAIVRTFEQARLVDLAKATHQLRIINALSNEEHPCQALADCLTLQERWGRVAGRRELLEPVDVALGLSQRDLGEADGQALMLVVEPHEDRAFLDPLLGAGSC